MESLQEERKRLLKANKLDNSKPIEQVLSNLFKHSSALSMIFLKGERLSNPFKSDTINSEPEIFKGKKFPTYFKFKKINYGEILRRDAHLNSKCRVVFETDAENEYFDRKTNPGTYKLLAKKSDTHWQDAINFGCDYSLNLYNGIGTLSVDLKSSAIVGESISFLLVVTDHIKVIDPPFENEFILHVYPPNIVASGGNSARKNPPGNNQGNERDKPSGIKFPEIIPVYEKDWELHSFNKYSALKVIKSKSGELGISSVEFTFYINMDNIYLQYEIKSDIRNKKECDAYFEYGMALLGISVIYDDQQNKDENNKFQDIEERIANFSRAMSPIIIPMIKEFGKMDLKDELIKELSG